MLKNKKQVDLNTNIDKIKNDIKRDIQHLSKHPDSAAIQYNISLKYKDLAKLTDNQDDYQQALTYCSSAIRIAEFVGNTNELKQYLTTRMSIHKQLKRYDLASSDLVRAANIETTDGFIESWYTDNAQNLIQLSSIKQEIKKLDYDNLPQSLKTILLDFVEIVFTLNDQVEKHEFGITDHESRITNLEELHSTLNSMLLDVIKSKSDDNNKIQVLTNMITTAQDSIQTLDNKISRVIDNVEEFNNLKGRFSTVVDTYNLFNGRFEMIEGTLNGQNQTIIRMDKALDLSNCYTKAAITENLYNLQTKDEGLDVYANTLYWAVSNYLLAYRSIGTGLIKGVDTTNMLNQVWSKIGSVIMKGSAAIPVVGGIIPTIEMAIVTINNAYKNMEFKRKVDKVNHIMSQHHSEENLNLSIAQAAIQIAKYKSAAIANAYSQQPLENNENNTITHTKKLFQKLEKKIDKLFEKTTGIEKIKYTSVQKMALKDAALLLNHIIMQKDNFMLQIDNGEQSDTALALEFKTTFIENEYLPENESTAQSLTVRMLTSIEYDCKLLNHPELLTKAVNHCGFDTTIDLAIKLPKNLVDEAIEHGDADLILAGILSLEC